MKLEIPTKYTVGGQEIKVEYKDNYEHLGTVSTFNGVLRIANTYKGDAQSQSSKLNTFYHELVHSILDTMGELNLTEDEKFVSSFSGFLLGALQSMEFNNNNPTL